MIVCKHQTSFVPPLPPPFLRQSEQIEKLYTQAVEATQNIGRANVQLGKAVRTNRSARKYLLAFFLVASLALLFLDWFNS